MPNTSITKLLKDNKTYLGNYQPNCQFLLEKNTNFKE